MQKGAQRAPFVFSYKSKTDYRNQISITNKRLTHWNFNHQYIRSAGSFKIQLIYFPKANRIAPTQYMSVYVNRPFNHKNIRTLVFSV